MSEFIPVKPTRKDEPVHLRLPAELVIALDEAVLKTGIKRPELIRQMLAHCLSQLGLYEASNFEKWTKK